MYRQQTKKFSCIIPQLKTDQIKKNLAYGRPLSVIGVGG